jgi:predicted  nucleic acid-binding Zn-ribbon protein
VSPDQNNDSQNQEGLQGGGMETLSTQTNTASSGAAKPKPPVTRDSLIPDGLKTALLFILILAFGYFLYDSYQFRQNYQADMAKLSAQISKLQQWAKIGESNLSSLQGEISKTQEAVGDTKLELKKTTKTIQSETEKSKAELSAAISSKADSAAVQQQMQAAKQEAEAKIGQVTSEVGGVKTEVGNVKTDLAATKRDLEGTQRQLVDVRDSLSTAVAKNASELSDLRRKGERDYVEFEIPKKEVPYKVEDIRLILKKTDVKKGKYSLVIVVDDSKLGKNDRSVNEPIQFLVGHNHVRYELVINWVQKDRIGGYLSVPKDKSLSAERPAR